ncbi:MAG TPA: GtrA family protein [Candidatus Desulfofervidus auxilii]|uniref:GtrA family protein n=1 Tax=Desulfofervidus auxilii TaxID=1621989 RepID=A0A7C0Y488_DESA2|nr:GtrA family protein [Candidatus Desulfofervidus auxilii]
MQLLLIEEFLKYFLIGSIAFGVDFTVLYISTEWIGLHYLISAAFGFSIGLVVNYLFSVNWVFKYRRMKNITVEFSIFSLVGFIGLIWNEFFMWFFTYIFSGRYLLAKIPTTVLVFIWNFSARKFLLFRRKTA